MQALTRGDRAALRDVHYAATEIGFATGENTSLSGGRVRDRILVPLFFNPPYMTNIAPPQSDQVISAGEHVERRFNETSLHVQKA